MRKLALDLGVRLEDVAPTGMGGRVTFDDVKRHASERSRGATAAPPAQAAEVEVERVPLRGIRRRVADAMMHSVKEIPHVSGFQEFDAGRLVALRERLRPQAEAAGLRLTFLPFVVRAAVLALRAHPYLNASFDAAEPAIVLKKTYGIGIATATDAGLVVPVVRHADRLGFLELARKIDGLAQAAREHRLTPEDFQHGTFTVTNVGPAGGWLGTSIIRHPEVAILGIGRIEERAVVRLDQIVARPILPVSLTFDHRVIDGDMGLAFLKDAPHAHRGSRRARVRRPARGVGRPCTGLIRDPRREALGTGGGGAQMMDAYHHQFVLGRHPLNAYEYAGRCVRRL